MERKLTQLHFLGHKSLQRSLQWMNSGIINFTQHHHHRDITYYAKVKVHLSFAKLLWSFANKSIRCELMQHISTINHSCLSSGLLNSQAIYFNAIVTELERKRVSEGLKGFSCQVCKFNWGEELLLFRFFTYFRISVSHSSFSSKLRLIAADEELNQPGFEPSFIHSQLNLWNCRN